MKAINDNQSEYYDQKFEQIDLSQQNISAKVFENCAFIQCNFSETEFRKCKFIDCQFIRCNLSNIILKLSSFRDTNFIESKVIGVNWTEAAWPSIKLTSPIHFKQCDISHSSLMGLHLLEINVIECQAINVDFREADLKQANFSHTDLTDSQFVNCNLTAADFCFAVNYSIDINTNKLTQAKFMLPEAAGLLYGLDIDLVDSV